MPEEPNAENASAEHVIAIERVFRAPRSLVWAAFTATEHLERWWGPEGFSTRVVQNEPRTGGRQSLIMVGPDGTEYPVGGTYIAFEPELRFVTTDEFEEGFPGETPSGIVLTALFEDVPDGTNLTLLIAHPDAASKKQHEDMGVVGGWNSSFGCLDAYLLTLR